jgi:bile acid-coenzyme A ligase
MSIAVAPAGAGLDVDVEPTFAQQFALHARARGETDAVIDSTGSVTFAELESRTNRLARLFAARGAGLGDFILLSSPVPSLLLVSAIAAWKIGAVPMPVSDRLVQRELDALVEVGRPTLAVDTTDRALDVPRITDLDEAAAQSADPLPPVVAPHLKSPTSGGTTGAPKLIVSGATATPEELASPGRLMGVPPHSVCLITAALYHNAVFTDALAAVALGSTTVLMDRFDAEETLAMIERHRAEWVYAVPTMMQRIWKLPQTVKDAYDLSSVGTLFHVAAPCPAWLKRAWIDWLGPEAIHELYGPTEAQAATTITGPQWLEHPGSVGAPRVGEVSIRDDEGRVLPVGETGMVWLRRGEGEPASYHYLGSEADDEELGSVPALVVETGSGKVPADLDDHLRAHLSRVKLPRRTVATTDRLRDAAGKIRKRDIRTRFLEA